MRNSFGRRVALRRPRQAEISAIEQEIADISARDSLNVENVARLNDAPMDTGGRPATTRRAGPEQQRGERAAVAEHQIRPDITDESRMREISTSGVTSSDWRRSDGLD